jgi:hypothetical protein
MVLMRRTVDLDKELEAELSAVVSLTKEKAAVVIRQALRAGLPAVANRFQAPRPEGYFAEMYQDWPDERIRLEEASSLVDVGSEERDRQ